MNLSPEAVEEYWPLTDVVVGKILNETEGRTTGELISREGRFIYKIAAPSTTDKVLEKNIAVFDILNEKKFKHITALLKTREGNKFTKISDHFTYLLAYVEGKNPDYAPKTYAKLGEITSALHTVKDYPFQTDFKVSGVIPDLIKNSEKYSFGKEYRRLLENLPNFDHLPQTLIHTDIHPGNTIETAQGEFVLIDWDDAGVGNRILDLGCIINQFVTEDLEFRKDNMKVFFDAYLSCQELSSEEIKYIFDAGLFFALFYIRFGDMEKRWKRIQWSLDNRESFKISYV